MNEGCELTMRMLLEAGFQLAAKVSTDGQPALRHAWMPALRAPLAFYYMYDVETGRSRRMVFAAIEAALVDKPASEKSS